MKILVLRYPMRATACLVLATLLLTAVWVEAASPGPALKVGEPAPRLQVVRWMQGDPVTGFEKGKTYLLEFWATWSR